MRRKYLKVILLTLVTGCTAGNSPSNAAETNSIEMVAIEKQLNDPLSPVGYWEVNLVYPQLKQTENKTFASVNKQISDLVSKYSCQDAGDQTFTADHVYDNGHVLSFYYEVMWMCATMPSPDSVSKTINYNLETGAPLLISREFIDSSDQGRFNFIANQFTEKNFKKLPEKNLSCAPFYSADQALLTAQGVEMRDHATIHGESDCQVSVVIPTKDLTSFFKHDSIILQ